MTQQNDDTTAVPGGGQRNPVDSEREHTANDRAASPGSERETEAKQAEAPDRSRTDTSGGAVVTQVPGTGGPDDVGDVDVPADEVSLDGKPFPGHAGTVQDES